jgi:hypothetical protein
MNNTFELRRFGLVFKKLLFERSLRLVGSFVLAALFTWFLYGATGLHLDGTTVTPASESFTIGLTLGGIYWVFTAFSYFSNHTEGYNYLMLPASHIEKWLSAVSLLGVFMLFFCLYFRVLDTIYLDKFLNSIVHFKNYQKILESAQVMAFWGDKRVDLEFNYFGFFSATGAMAVGSLYFNKNTFIKAASIGFVFFIGLMLSNMKMANVVFSEHVGLELNWRGAMIHRTDYYVQLPEPINTVYMIGFNYVLPVALWLIALIRLREKEL